MSFHMMNLPKENCPIFAMSRTSHPSMTLMASRNLSKMAATSTPDSSVGSGSNPSIVIRNICFRSSSKVTLMMVSSSDFVMKMPSRNVLRTMRNGMRINGAM